MGMLFAELTKDDFADVPWEELAEAASELTWRGLLGQFHQRAQELPPNSKSRRAFEFLTEIFRVRLDRHPIHGDAFAPHGEFIQEHHLDLLRQIIPSVRDPEVRARMADLVWSRKRKGSFPLVWTAIESYLESSTRLEKGHWPPAFAGIERALQLAVTVRNADYIKRILDHAEGCLLRLNGEDPYIFSACLIDMLLEHDHGDPLQFASLAEKLAAASEPRELFDQARRYWQIAARCSMQVEPGRARSAALSAAETYVKDGQSRIDHNQLGCYGVASEFLLRAIEAYGKIEDTEEIIKGLKRQLRLFQKKADGEMVSFPIDPPDLSIPTKASEERIAGLSLKEAIVALATAARPTDADGAIRRTRERRESGEYHIFWLMSQTIVNSSGAPIARSPDINSNDSDEVEKAILAQTHQDAHHGWQIHVVAAIEPARRIFLQEHYDVGVRDLLEFVVDNPFVPHGREIIFARGLWYGLRGDFLLATHLLIPQVENLIRHILYRMDVATFKIVGDKVQDERGLTMTLLEEPYVSALEKVFGKNILFDLRALLISRFGSNLRHNMAHGLIDHQAFYTVSTCYLWWLILHICILPATGRGMKNIAPPDVEGADLPA